MSWPAQRIYNPPAGSACADWVRFPRLPLFLAFAFDRSHQNLTSPCDCLLVIIRRHLAVCDLAVCHRGLRDSGGTFAATDSQALSSSSKKLPGCRFGEYSDPAVGQTLVSPAEDSRGLVFERLTSQFEKYRRDVDPAWLVEDKFEAERLGALLQSAMRLLIREADLPDEIDAVVDVEFGSGASRGLDARLRQIDVEAGRELHFCVRALERRHANAFQARLKASLTESGIDPTLRFRRLTVFRSAPIPSGPKTATLMQKFESSGGVMLAIPEDELRTLAALRKLEADRVRT